MLAGGSIWRDNSVVLADGWGKEQFTFKGHPATGLVGGCNHGVSMSQEILM
jgi:hypothetical protein